MSWFKKKPTPEPEVRAAPVAPAAAPPPPAPAAASAQPSAGAAALIGRWDALIADNRARLQALLDEAVAGSEPLIPTIRTDLNPLVLPWNTITPRVREASDEVSDFWNKISDEMSESGFTHDMIRAEGTKRDLATLELDFIHERAYGGVMARAARQMQANAVDDTSRRIFVASGAMHLAVEAARPLNEAMRRLETQIKQYREAKEVPLAMLIELETTSRNYWTTRLSEEARYNPDDAKYVPAKLDRYMKDVLKTLRRYWQWREHESTLPPTP